MKNFLQKFKKFIGLPFALFLIAVFFLGVTLGTSGSTDSVGSPFELQYTSDKNWSWVIFKVSAPKTLDEDGKETDMDVRLCNAYLNLGKIYSEEATAAIELQYGSSSSTSAENFFRLGKMKTAVFHNTAYVPQEGDKKTEPKDTEFHVYDYAYRWVAPFGVSELDESDSYRILKSSPRYFKLVMPKVSGAVQKGNVLVNEIVFVGEEYENGNGTGKLVVLPVEIDSRTYLPADDRKEGVKRAEALIDAQTMPSLSSSSYYRYGDEETRMLMTLSEMKLGNSYINGDKYAGDRTYNSLGINLAYLGTLMFGTSPFGLRFFNALASFGILMVGFFFVKRLFSNNERAGLSFAIIYALSGVSISLAHLVTPVMLGVFFLLSSLALCYRYFVLGMKKSSPVQTLPLFFSGICGALAILVNGAFLIPVLGVAALFAAGAIRQHKKNRAALDEAIAFAEAERAEGIAALSEDGTKESEGNQRVRTALSKYRYDTAATAGVFSCGLILGTLVLSILSVIPVFYAADKIYNGIANPNLFTIAFQLFSAGFKGNAGTSGWNYFYPILTGEGGRAVTLGVVNFTATLLGLFGIALAIYFIVALAKRKAPIEEFVKFIVPLAGLLLSLATAAFAGGAIAFVLLANLFAFALVSGGAELFEKEGKKQATATFIVKIVALVLLIACFALVAAFTFSIPLPATIATKLF